MRSTDYQQLRTERVSGHIAGAIISDHVLTCLPVKSKPVQTEEDDEEEELRKLQAEMAM